MTDALLPITEMSYFAPSCHLHAVTVARSHKSFRVSNVPESDTKWGLMTIVPRLLIVVHSFQDAGTVGHRVETVQILNDLCTVATSSATSLPRVLDRVFHPTHSQTDCYRCYSSFS